MSARLDGQELFDAEQLSIEVGGSRREFAERTVAGLDGAVSIDLGGRGRQIKQKGTLRAASRAGMSRRIEAISAFMDGGSHALASGTGEEYEDVRMDFFRVGDERMSGSGVTVSYEIVYTQLKV